MQPHSEALLLYDGTCSLCCQLAQWVERRAAGRVAIESWQDYAVRTTDELHRVAPADRLRVLADGVLHEGDGAWAWLLDRHPDLEALSWMAARLGLSSPVARALRGTADLLKRLCRHCGRKGLASDTTSRPTATQLRKEASASEDER